MVRNRLPILPIINPRLNIPAIELPRKYLPAIHRVVFVILSYQFHPSCKFSPSIERPTPPNPISNVHPTASLYRGYSALNPNGSPSIYHGSKFPTAERPAGTKQLKRHSQPTSLAPHSPYKQVTPPAAPLQHPHPNNKLQVVPYHDYHHQFH